MHIVTFMSLPPPVTAHATTTHTRTAARRYFLSHCESAEKAVRFRCVQIVTRLFERLPEDAEVSEDLYNQIKSTLLTRLRHARRLGQRANARGRFSEYHSDTSIRNKKDAVLFENERDCCYGLNGK